MKVCYIAHRSVSLAGGELSLLGLMDNVRKFGVEPVLVSDEESPLTEKAAELGILTKVIPLKNYTYQRKRVTLRAHLLYPAKRLYNLRFHQEMRRFLEEEKVELIHFNSSVVCHEWANVARKAGIPYVWHLREFMDLDHDAVVIGQRYFDSLIQSSARIIAISGSVQKRWSEKLGRECDLVYNGLKKQDFYLEHDILKEETVKCVIIARVVPGKGQLEAVEAIKELVDRGITKVRLCIVGFRFMEGSDYEKEVSAFIEDNHLEPFVELREFTSDVRKIHEENDVGLVCSRAEAFGRITIEYMLAGLLAVGSNSGGTPELIDQGKTGLMYEQGDPKDLADRLEWIVTHREEARTIARNGQEAAEQKFSIEKTAENVYRIYQEVLS